MCVQRRTEKEKTTPCVEFDDQPSVRPGMPGQEYIHMQGKEQSETISDHVEIIKTICTTHRHYLFRVYSLINGTCHNVELLTGGR